MTIAMQAGGVETLRWNNGVLEMIDQRVLPARFEYIPYDSAASVAEGIKTMVVRGAPAIGCAAAYGVALEAKRLSVIADETRPCLQGARLTAWEMVQEKIPVTLITDNMAGFMMSKGEVDAVVVGTDRVAANGDVANKIGTYMVAVLAKRHNIP